jgi:hypothetical protein
LKRACWTTNSGASVNATVYIDSTSRVYDATVSPSVTTYTADSAYAQEGSSFALLGDIPGGNDFTDYGDITSGIFDFTGISSLQIDWMMATGIYTSTSMYSSGSVYNYTYTADFELQYRTSPTSSWITVAEIDDTLTDGWEHFSLKDPIIDLSSQMQFRFYSPYHSAPAIAIDSVSFKQGSTCVKPVNLTTDFITQGAAQVSWTGIASSYTYEAGIAGQSSTYGGSTSGDSVVFSGLTPKTTYWFTVSPNCGTGIVSPTSDTLYFSTDCDEISTFPTIESFESNSTWELCWNTYGSSSTYLWDLNRTSSYQISSAFDGTEYAWANYYGTRYLESPVIDASSLVTLSVEFYYFIDEYYGGGDELSVEYRMSPSGPWVNLLTTSTPTSNWTKGFVVVPSTGSEMQIRFVSVGKYKDGIGLDLITFDEGPTCLPVNIASIDDITDNSATVVIDGPSANYEVMIEQPSVDPTDGSLIFSQATGVTYTVSQDSVQQLSSLTAESIYGVWVRAVCAPGDTSDWSSVNTFTTMCAALSLPYTEEQTECII